MKNTCSACWVSKSSNSSSGRQPLSACGRFFCWGRGSHGIHPAHNRQAAAARNHAENANTFEAVAREWIARKKQGWTPHYLRQVERFHDFDVFPYIGSLPIRNMTAAHLLEIVRRVEGRGAATGALLVAEWGW